MAASESISQETAQPTSVQGDPVELGIPKQEKTGQLPALTTALSERATQAFGKKDWKTAREAYLEMLKEEPRNALTLANLGAVEQQDGKLKEAQSYFSRALLINPGLQQTWTALGLVSYELGDSYYAVSALTRAIHEDPTDARAHNYLAAAVKRLGWLDAAEAELRRAIELYPEYANAHFNLALMYLDRKPPAIELARRHYETALSLGSGRDELVDEKLKKP
ncbi:tetratricopeptide repeat protein [Phragmitibacter flavus]|nr:tetratricopeptide repeat protein [Phragmitibacter flavus]